MHFFPLTWLGAIAASTALGKTEARVLSHSTAGFLTTRKPFDLIQCNIVGISIQDILDTGNAICWWNA